MSLKTWGTGAVLSLVLGVAHALPAVSLSFAQPDGVVGPTDEIPVQLLLSVDPDATESLVLDFDSPTLGLLDPPLSGTYSYQDAEGVWQGVEVPFVSYEYAYLSNWFGCAGTFTNGCTNGTPYTFSFGDGAANVTSLAPGDVYLLDFGVFKPAHGAVPAGTYVFHGAGLDFSVYGQGEDPFNPGEMVSIEFRQVLTSACSDWWAGTDSVCTGAAAFSRTVMAPVPEPGAWALMAAGLLVALPSWRAQQRRARKRHELV